MSVDSSNGPPEHAARVLGSLTAGYGTLKIARYLLPPLLPLIVSDLGITSFEAGVALSVTVVAVAVTQYPSGRYSDGLSRRTVLLASLVCLVAGLVVLGGAPTYATFLLGMTLLGAGEGLYSPASRALISDLYAARRGQAFGLHMMSVDVGGLIAAGAATVLLASGRWRAAFVPLAGVTVVVGAVYLRWSREPIVVGRVDLDVRATVRRLFAVPELRLLTVAYCMFMTTIQGVLGFLPTLLGTEVGLSPELASSTFAVLFAAGLVIKPASGRLSDRFPRPAVGGAALLVGTVGIASVIVADGVIGASVALVGVAVGTKGFGPAMQAYLMDHFPAESMGGDFGALRTAYMGVGALGPVYVGAVAERVGYGPAFAGLAALFGTAGILVLYGWRRY